ncbi:MAG: hypothetical protein ACM3Q2_04165 [Syntrophothermus sp.]
MNLLISMPLSMLLLLLFNVSGLAQQSKVKQIERVSFDWQNTGKLYDLIIESTSDFERLRIKTPGLKDFTLVDSTGFFPATKALLDSALIKNNLSNSKYTYMSPELKSQQKYPALIVFGNPEASDPGSIHIIMLDSLGVPKEIFYSDTFQLTDIKDIDNDGFAEFIGKHCLSQLWGNSFGEECFSTYDPYSVYKMSAKGNGKLLYNTELSKQYNIDHYYGWAGKECSEETIVVLCIKDGKPKIMKRIDAERIYK